MKIEKRLIKDLIPAEYNPRQATKEQEKHLQESLKKFGLLRIISLFKKDGKTYAQCLCDCGNKKEIYFSSIKIGATKSCGCIRRNRLIERNKKIKNIIHGMSGTRINQIYKDMKDRCYNKNNKRYKNYGGRNIILCDKWKLDFKSFLDWSKISGYKENLTIDRINNNGNYEPLNCRWITIQQQQFNRSNNHYLTFKGKTMTITEWANFTGFKRGTLFIRANKGLPVEQIFSSKRLKNKSEITL